MTTWAEAGGGLWRLTLHHRAFAAGITWESSLITELPNARSRRLEQKLNDAATLTFTLSGEDPEASEVRELQTEVMAWRAGVPYFRGIVAQSQDSISETVHTTTFTCHDLFAMVQRRYLTGPLIWADPGVPQDQIVATLLDAAMPYPFRPGSFLPLEVATVARDGSPRVPGGPNRVRSYEAQSSAGKLIEDLAGVIDGFDFDVAPSGADMGNADDHLRVFYKWQGVDRAEPLEYGAALASVSRSLNSADYANYWRVIGNNGSSDPAAPQLAAEISNADANDVGRIPVGLWQDIESASDVSDQGTLAEHAAGDLNRSALLVPSYTLGLRPGAYAEDSFNMGDTVPLVIRSGRLNVYGPAARVRIVGRSFDIGDHGTEDVALTVGRPLTSLVDMLAANAADIQALARR